MKIPKTLQIGNLVSVIWEDIAASSEWFSPEELNDFGVHTMETVGWVFRINKHLLVIHSTRELNPASKGSKDPDSDIYSEITSIPIGCITKVRKL